MSSLTNHPLVAKAEEVADEVTILIFFKFQSIGECESKICNLFISSQQVLRRTRTILPHLARLCLIATFFEDGFRMWIQWNEQREYMDISWGCGQILATLFVIINLFGQLGGCLMVLLRIRVDIACVLLFCIVLLQVW